MFLALGSTAFPTPTPPPPLSALEGRGPGSPACSCPSKPHVFTEQGSGLCGCRGQAVGAEASPQVPTLGNRGGPDGVVLLPRGWRGAAARGRVGLHGRLSLLLRGRRSSGPPHPPGPGQLAGSRRRAALAAPWSQGPRAESGAASRCPCARRAWLPVKEAGRASCEPAPAGIRHLLLRPEAGAAWGGHRPKGAPPGGGMSPARKRLPPPATACGTSPPALPWPAWTAGAGTEPGDRGEVAPGRRRRSDPRAWVTARGRGLRLRAPRTQFRSAQSGAASRGSLTPGEGRPEAAEPSGGSSRLPRHLGSHRWREVNADIRRAGYPRERQDLGSALVSLLPAGLLLGD